MYIVKECTKCKEFKLLEEFSVQTRGYFGRKSTCKDCNKQYRQENKEHIKQYYQENKEHINKRQKKYNQENKERVKERTKQYYEENKERLNERNRQWREENKERLKEKGKQYREENKEWTKEYHKQYREENKERLNERNRQRKKTDPIYKLRCNISSLISNSIKNQSYSKTSRTHQILGCDYDTFKKHLKRQFTKGMNWSNYGEWHLDHIYPVSLAEDEAHLLRLNHYTNFQPLWEEDNLRKSNKVEEHQLMIRL